MSHHTVIFQPLLVLVKVEGKAFASIVRLPMLDVRLSKLSMS